MVLTRAGYRVNLTLERASSEWEAKHNSSVFQAKNDCSIRLGWRMTAIAVPHGPDPCSIFINLSCQDYMSWQVNKWKDQKHTNSCDFSMY